MCRGLHGMGVHGMLMLITHSPGVPLFARARCRSAQCARAGHSRHWHARCARAGRPAIGHALLPGMAWACTYCTVVFGNLFLHLQLFTNNDSRSPPTSLSKSLNRAVYSTHFAECLLFQSFYFILVSAAKNSRHLYLYASFSI